MAHEDDHDAVDHGGAARAGARMMPRILSLRLKLFLAAIAGQGLVLVALTTQSLDFINTKLEERAQLRLDEEKRLLVASLTDPLQRRDLAAIQAVLARVLTKDGIAYVLLFDASGKLIAKSSWNEEAAPPPTQANLRDQPALKGGRFHTEAPIEAQGQVLGMVRFGVSTAFMDSARRELIHEAILTGALALIVSALLMAMVSYWLTRNLRQLTSASKRLAAGDFTVRLPVGSDDEIGTLTAAFNAMADALRSRIDALAQNEAKFHAIADYSYDVELWIGTEGRLAWINPRVHEMFGYTPEECLEMENFPAALVDPEDVVRTIRQIRQALRGNAGQDFEFRARRKDGTLLWGAADWRPIYGSDREYLGIRISIRDVSQRREAEQRLAATVAELREAQVVQQDYLRRAQDEQARLSALLSAMEFGILFVNTANRIVYVNPAFNRLWQIADGAEILGRD